MNRIRVVQFGLGPIGQACVKVLSQKSGIELVGGIDIDAGKIGKDLGEVCGLNNQLGVTVRGDAETALAQWQPHVVVHTTLSFLNRIEDQLTTIIKSRAHVVSSTEELFYPYQRNPEFCQRIDALAKQHGVGVVGTGVNPGFSMDVLPLCLTGVCTEVKKITATRVVDAGKRRLPLQKKIGAGISRKEFRERAATGTFGHIGLQESALAVMNAMSWPVDEMKESLKPMIADKRVKTPYLIVEPGQVTGIHQIMRVKSGGQERLKLELQMYVGAKQPHDSVEIAGNPPLSMRIDGGIFGDTATIAALVNAIPKIMNAPPGLRTMLDLPVPYAFL
ncbi:MAG: dihydrodipicolinate reductase [candidate division KSB1 bacterium]|nr:dihydrodipicolinate reductase [candidate division KSB1 bacterium]MDZ7367923.1 dihydrodipicolinate reductase [candidate division KSB1 bacterium]MDZ7406510.1 dihydrodipicolinate reductase [candidate division KSB1 bacterium]